MIEPTEDNREKMVTYYNEFFKELEKITSILGEYDLDCRCEGRATKMWFLGCHFAASPTITQKDGNYEITRSMNVTVYDGDTAICEAEIGFGTFTKQDAEELYSCVCEYLLKQGLY